MVIDDASSGEQGDLAAGSFSAWLRAMERAIDGAGEADVPCGRCTACCRSSQFVHITPDETDTLARIPRAMRFPAPGLPAGHVLLGYDEHGRCPMLADDGCSIYEHRPRTCRTYDCRVFPAAGVDPDDKPLVAERARRWRFDHPAEGDRVGHDAVRAAARFLRRYGEQLGGGAPASPTQLAVTAVDAHEAFLDRGGPRPIVVTEPAVAEVRVVLSRRRRSA